ncbi:MAG: recombinase family protein [Candidatus Aegiribacteria sp.]|nr:recombinase family protein [Candidatus Aegiribacteria sp.]
MRKSSFYTSKPFGNGAVIYCRVSTEEQVEKGDSLRTQERNCREYCKNQNIEVKKVIYDRGASATNLERPGFEELVKYCTDHKEDIRYIIVWQYSRFTRNQYDFQAVKILFRALGIIPRSVCAPVEDTPAGEFMENVLVSIAQYDSAITGMRAKAGMIQARLQGKLTHKAPIGYINKRDEHDRAFTIVDPEIAPFIKEAFEMFTTGTYTKDEIVDHLNNEGFLTHKGKPLSKQTLNRILRNQTYAGLVFVDEEHGSVEADFPALISKHMFEEVQRMNTNYATKETVNSRKKSSGFPLTRFLRCSKCNEPLTGSYSTGKLGKKYPYYKCRSKSSHFSIRKEILEAEYLNLLHRLKPEKGILKAFKSIAKDIWKEKTKNVRSEIAALRKHQTELQEKYDRLLDLYIDGRLTESDFDRKKSSLSTEIFKSRLSLERLYEHELTLDSFLEQGFALLENIDVMWLESSNKGKRQLQRALFPEGLSYSKDEGFETPTTSKAFNILEVLEIPEKQLVPPTGFELLRSSILLRGNNTRARIQIRCGHLLPYLEHLPAPGTVPRLRECSVKCCIRRLQKGRLTRR